MLSMWAQAGPILGVCVSVSIKVRRAKAQQAWVGLAASSVESRGTAWVGAALIESCSVLQRRTLGGSGKPGT